MRAVAIVVVLLATATAPALGKTIATETADGTRDASLELEHTFRPGKARSVSAASNWTAIESDAGVIGDSPSPDVRGRLVLMCGTSWQSRTFTTAARIVIPPRSRTCKSRVTFSVEQAFRYPIQPVQTSLRVVLSLP